MKWISVKTKKPRLGQEVLCYYKGIRPYDGSVYDGFRVLFYMKSFYDSRKRVFTDEDRDFYDLGYGKTDWPVTHWMPIHEP